MSSIGVGEMFEVFKDMAESPSSLTSFVTQEILNGVLLL